MCNVCSFPHTVKDLFIHLVIYANPFDKSPLQCHISNDDS